MSFDKRRQLHDKRLEEIRNHCDDFGIPWSAQDIYPCDPALREINTLAAYAERHRGDLIIGGDKLVEVKCGQIQKFDDGSASMMIEFACWYILNTKNNPYIIDSNEKLIPLSDFVPQWNIYYAKWWRDKDDDSLQFVRFCEDYAKERDGVCMSVNIRNGSGTPFINIYVEKYEKYLWYCDALTLPDHVLTHTEKRIQEQKQIANPQTQTNAEWIDDYDNAKW